MSCMDTLRKSVLVKGNSTCRGPEVNGPGVLKEQGREHEEEGRRRVADEIIEIARVQVIQGFVSQFKDSFLPWRNLESLKVWKEI